MTWSIWGFLPLLPVVLVLGNRKGDHVFYDTDVVSLVDPLVDGFHLIMTDEAHNYLLVNPFQLPALYITALPLDGIGTPVRRILFKDSVANKIVKVSGLRESTWYHLCLEYETFSIGTGLNETTGTKCQVRRTLDRFGKNADGIVEDVRFLRAGDSFLEFQVVLSPTYPVELTFYLEEGLAPVKNLILEGPKTLDIRFADLQPDTIQGRLCILEEPLAQGYTAMGRTIQTRKKSCYQSKSTKTKPLQTVSDSAQLRASRNTLVMADQIKTASQLHSSSAQTLKLHSFFVCFFFSTMFVGLMKCSNEIC